MCRLLCPTATSFVWTAVFFLSLTLSVFAQANVQPKQAGKVQSHNLYLAVVINGNPLGLIAEFQRWNDGTITSTRKELSEIGIKTNGDVNEDMPVDLSTLEDFRYHIDDISQEIYLETDSSRLKPAIYDAGVKKKTALTGETPVADFGSVINYTLFATTNADIRRWYELGDHQPVFSGSVDGRVFGSFGVLSQSAIANSNLAGVDNAVRLDTTWSFSDPQTIRTYNAGDLISGGLSWTRSVRLGGIQVQRNFDLKPDLITFPVPDLSGSAAVPSTVEVYANNVRLFNQDIPAGPFVISNLPVVTGAGTAQVVINDSLGRQSVTNVPFYSSSKQLRGGIYDFSIEAGVLRRSYGVHSNDYIGGLAGSMSLRYGVSDSLTLEAHTELNHYLFNGGAGAVLPVGNFGTVSIAAASSHDRSNDKFGALLSASAEMDFGGLKIHARTQRTLGDYNDLASVGLREISLFNNETFYQGKPPRSVDHAVLSVPLTFDSSRIILSYTHLENQYSDHFRTVGVTYNRSLFNAASFYVSGFAEIGGNRDYGLFAGVTMTLGNDISSTLSLSSDADDTVGGIDVSKSEKTHPGSFGWRLRDREGDRADRSASASYRTRSARLRGTVQQYGDAIRATGELGGAVVITAGEAFFTPHIYDSFALVDVGAPDVEVFQENRLVGRTDRQGRLLVPGLNAYQPNTISIDPKNLPVDAEIPFTRKTVVPSDRSGVIAEFGVDTAPGAALVTFRNDGGDHLPVGSKGRIDGSKEDFIIGYDGQAYLKRLSQENTVHVALATGGTCRAFISFHNRPPGRVHIEDVPCR